LHSGTLWSHEISEATGGKGAAVVLDDCSALKAPDDRKILTLYAVQQAMRAPQCRRHSEPTLVVLW
jgi:hypothetical protein